MFSTNKTVPAPVVHLRQIIFSLSGGCAYNHLAMPNQITSACCEGFVELKADAPPVAWDYPSHKEAFIAAAKGC